MKMLHFARNVLESLGSGRFAGPAPLNWSPDGSQVVWVSRGSPGPQRHLAELWWPLDDDISGGVESDNTVFLFFVASLQAADSSWESWESWAPYGAYKPEEHCPCEAHCPKPQALVPYGALFQVVWPLLYCLLCSALCEAGQDAM